MKGYRSQFLDLKLQFSVISDSNVELVVRKCKTWQLFKMDPGRIGK